MKDQVKRLGKKGREEAAGLEAELVQRHATELAALEAREARTASGAEVVAVADSLYSVHLDGSTEGKVGDKVGTRRGRVPGWQGGWGSGGQGGVAQGGKRGSEGGGCAAGDVKLRGG